MKFIRRIELALEEKNLILYVNTRKVPFIYHYDTKAWELGEGDSGENITKAVLKFTGKSSLEEVVKEYSYKHYLEVFQSQLHHIDSKSAMGIFKRSTNLEKDINELFVAPAMETVEVLSDYADRRGFEAEIREAVNRLYGKGSESMIKTAIADYSEEKIEFDELNSIFYKFIDYLRRSDMRTAERLDKQIDVLFKQNSKRLLHH